MLISSERPLLQGFRVAKSLLVVSLLGVSLVALLLFSTPSESAAAQEAPVITITKTVVGDPSPEPFSFVISPDVDGCTAEQTVSIDGAGGSTAAAVADAVAGPIAFDAADFVVTPIFNDVQDFEFTIAMTGITPMSTYVNAPFAMIDYEVRGDLGGTPSGFPSFNLVRSITFGDFVTQGSSLGFVTADDADMSDGLQVAELFGPNDVFILNAREVDTGRYHPPRLVLRADGTGRIENSNNQGGINPQTMELVDVEKGEEYITDLAFDPETLTLAPGVACTYTVTEQPAPGFEPDKAFVTGLAAGGQVSFQNTAVPVLCAGLPVTIDMRTNGGNGTGTAGPDVILGTVGADVIDAGAGDDTVCAGAGDDLVIGGDGDDMLLGGTGRDIMRGNAGSDELNGEAGNDRLLGGIDADSLDGGEGDDFLGGFGGADSILGGPGNDTIFGGFGGDTIDGGAGDDTIRGLIGDDTIRGGVGNDVLDGDRGNDVINGDDGDDVIRGGNANDILNGDDGDDSVSGGKADDTLSGGAGNADVCVGNKHIIADTADDTCETIFGVP